MNSKNFLLGFCLAILFSCNKDTEKIIYVADAMINCTGTATQKCLQIRDSEKDNWSNFYGKIEGFDFEPGYNYKLKVEVSKIENPPADAPSETYILIELLEKTKVKVGLANGSWLVYKIKDKTTFERNPVITLTLPQTQITGSTGCNKFFGNIDLENSGFKVNSLGSTKMACQNMDTEHLFLETLNEIVSYKIEDEKLKLYNMNQEVVMECSYLTERE